MRRSNIAQVRKPTLGSKEDATCCSNTELSPSQVTSISESFFRTPIRLSAWKPIPEKKPRCHVLVLTSVEMSINDTSTCFSTFLQSFSFVPCCRWLNGRHQNVQCLIRLCLQKSRRRVLGNTSQVYGTSRRRELTSLLA